MEQTRWISRSSNMNKETADLLVRELGIDPLIAGILAGRGLDTPEKARTFLEPSLASLHDPFLLPDMRKAVARILEGIGNGEKITVYADYDADGTTAAGILLSYLRETGAEIDHYIPNRLKEGYGMNVPALTKIKQRGTTLIITVDNGISSLKEADWCRQNGIDLIITDHHEPQESLPVATAVIDAKRTDSVYPFSELCGAGIAFKLVQALESEIDSGNDLIEYLQMAAVATVADLVPLKDENRSIAGLGIRSMNEEGCYNPGLAALTEVSEVKKLTAGNIGYVIGPMINAPGRLGEADRVIELYLAEDDALRMEGAALLHTRNLERRDIERAIFEQAKTKIIEEHLEDNCILVLAEKGWHSGVVGIAASRIQELWYRPVIVIGIDENGVGRGSCRSIEGVNIFKALCSVSDLFLSFGGHEQAAGFSIREENIPALQKRLLNYVQKHVPQDCFIKPYRFDAQAKADDITLGLAQRLEAFEPCGIGNPAPIFLLRRLTPQNVRLIGADSSHLSFKLSGIRCIGFSMAEKMTQINAQTLSVLAKPEINCYNDLQTVQLNLKDLKSADKKELSLQSLLALLSEKDMGLLETQLNKAELSLSMICVERRRLIMLYNCFRKAQGKSMAAEKLQHIIQLSLPELAGAVSILSEEGLISFSCTDNTVQAELLPAEQKIDITKNRFYKHTEKPGE